jgi:hypothetical protein
LALFNCATMTDWASVASLWSSRFVNCRCLFVENRERRQRRVKTGATWSAEQLAAWLTVATKDRDAGMWVLVATTGMRRSELAGAGARSARYEHPERPSVSTQSINVSDHHTLKGKFNSSDCFPHLATMLHVAHGRLPDTWRWCT